MARLSVFVLNMDGPEAPILQIGAQAAQAADMSFTSETGGYEGLRSAVRDWTILPEVVLIQVPQGRDAQDVVAEYGSDFPEGDTEVILYNAPNDIPCYRSLKSMGIREVFPGVPTEEELTETLMEIRQGALRRSGIDPRKTVYVFSACGGAGGTSVALSIARHYATTGKRTLYLDLDLATGPASFMFNAEKGARETNGLMEALANPNRIDALFLERAIEIAYKNLFYLSARRRTSDPTPDPKSVPVLIARAQQNFDMVVIDVPWRATPEPDMIMLQGSCYIVAPPTPQGLLGFSVLAKEIAEAPARCPMIGVLNRQGEFRNNDIDKASFKSATDVEILTIPYDAASAGRMFFDQKTFQNLGGKVAKAFARVTKTLPGQPEAEKKKKKGLFG